MISVILLVLTVIMVALGAFFGFCRGIVKEGVRVVLWGVLFACSCFFIPQISEKLPLLLAECFEMTAADVEQFVAELLIKSEILRNETYLILPLTGFVRTLLIPFITIALFWTTGFVSWILYQMVALFLRTAIENQSLVSELAGLAVGIFAALFGGALTIYPIASISTALQEGDAEERLTQNNPLVEVLADSYKGTMVQLPYQFTGTEYLAGMVHHGLNNSVVSAEAHVFWTELPKLVHLASAGTGTYAVVNGTSKEQLEPLLKETAEAYFALDFISEENQLLLLECFKTTLESSSDNGMVTALMNLLPVQSKEQLVSDIMVYVGVYDFLKAEKILDALFNGKSMPVLTEETGNTFLHMLYGLSNAEEVVPEMTNLLYSWVLAGAEKKLIRTEYPEWDEQTKEDISEVVTVICKLSSAMKHADSMTAEEKETILEAVKALKDNKAVDSESYEALMEILEKTLVFFDKRCYNLCVT